MVVPHFLKNKYVSNLVLISFIILFVSAFTAIFSAQNTLIGVSCIIGILLFKAVDINIKTSQASILIAFSFFLIAITSLLPFVNLFLGLAINIVFIFLVVILTSSNFMVKSYIPFLMCYAFASSEPILVEDIPLRMASLATTGILCAIVYYVKHKNNTIQGTVKSYVLRLSKNSDEFIYAIKMTIGLSLGLLIVYAFDIQKGIWITMTITSLTQIDSAVMIARTKYRILGTLVGSIAFVFLFEIFLPTNIHIFVTLLFSYIYTFLTDYFYQIIFITISALGIASALFSSNTSIPMRIFYIIIGIAISYAVHIVQKLLKRGKA